MGGTSRSTRVEQGIHAHCKAQLAIYLLVYSSIYLGPYAAKRECLFACWSE